MRKIDRFDILVIFLVLISYSIIAVLPFKVLPFGDDYFFEETMSFVNYFKGIGPSSQLAITHAPGPILFFLIPYLIIKAGSAAKIYWMVGVIWSGLWMTFGMLFLRRAGKLLFKDITGKISVLLFM